LLEASGNRIGHAKALAQLGASLARPGAAAEGETYVREAEAILRRQKPTKELANVLSILSVVREFQGDTEGAMKLVEESLGIARRFGHRSGIELLAMNLAEYEFSRGEVKTAVERAREAEAACRRSGNRRIMAYLLGNLGGYLIATGQTAEAKSVAAEAIRLTRSLGLEREPMIWAIEHLALLAALHGDFASSAALIGFGSAWYRNEDKVRDKTEQATYERVRELLGASLDPAERARLEAQGGGWTEDQAVAAALATAGEDAGD
jgi:ATP/maltotriose-dependent transcriptional regulator MalT